MSIHILPPEIAEQIAAGEVVENPASVVKELVENALDAGASLVEVTIKGGGLREIVVMDNGSGIAADEVSLAFQRHATSKVSTLEDLYAINTLGFRGEALASISSVSRVKMVTRHYKEVSGTSLKVEGGNIISLEEHGSPVGTEVVVADLFYNTPARRSFLGSASQEMGRISHLLTGLALSYPGTAFTLFNESRITFKTKGDGRVKDIITEAYGVDTSRQMMEINRLEKDGFSVEGFISAPFLHRSTRRYQTIIVNRRRVFSPHITRALEQAYRGLLHAGRYPLGIIYITVPAEFIDVNVHPSKAEIRFHKPEEVGELLRKAVQDSLQRSGPRFYFSPGGAEINTTVPSKQKASYPELPSTPSIILEENSTGKKYNLRPNFTPPLQTVAGKPDLTLFPGPYLKVIGQYLSSYIIIQKDDELVLIDQHAAHERILFEQLKKTYETASYTSSPLAVPLTVEIPLNWEGKMEPVAKFLGDIGLVLDPFGYNNYIIRQIPSFLVSICSQDFILDLLDELVEGEKMSRPHIDTVLKTAACKGAVKANHSMPLEEMEALVQMWNQTQNPFYCPHGRPAAISFTRYGLEKGFQRRGGGSGS